MEVEISPVSEKGQVVIPSSIRKKLDITSKDQLIWLSEDDSSIRVKKLNKKLVAAASFDKEWEPLRKIIKKEGFSRGDLSKEIAAARKK